MVGHRGGFWGVAAGVLVGAGLLLGAVQSKRPAESSDPARVVVDSALALPVEYAADIAFDLLERSLIKDRAARREILERLYSLAGTARRRVAVADAGAALADTADTLSGSTAKASNLHLDQQSIQLRAVGFMLALDRERGRAMFDDAPEPRLDPIECSEALVYDLSLYYSTLERVFQEGFSKAEREKGDDIQFLRLHFGATRSVSQLAPVLQLLPRLPLSGSDRQELTNLVARQLPAVTGGDREFAFAERQGHLGQQVYRLTSLLPSDDAARRPLVLAYRSLALSRMSGKRCSDSRSSADSKQKRGDAATVDRFNTQLLPFLGDDSFRIKDDEVRPEFSLDAAKITGLPYPDFHGQLSQLIQLRNSAETDWSSPAAKQVVRGVLDAAGAVREQEKTASCGICFFFARGSLDTLLISLLPSGQVDDVIDDYVRLLASSPFQVESPSEWLWQLRFLLSSIRTIAPEERGEMDRLRQKGKMLSVLPSASREFVLENMLRSSNPILGVYALREQLFPQAFRLPRAHRDAQEPGRRAGSPSSRLIACRTQ